MPSEGGLYGALGGEVVAGGPPAINPGPAESRVAAVDLHGAEPRLVHRKQAPVGAKGHDAVRRRLGDARGEVLRGTALGLAAVHRRGERRGLRGARTFLVVDVRGVPDPADHASPFAVRARTQEVPSMVSLRRAEPDLGLEGFGGGEGMGPDGGGMGPVVRVDRPDPALTEPRVGREARDLLEPRIGEDAVAPGVEHEDEEGKAVRDRAEIDARGRTRPAPPPGASIRGGLWVHHRGTSLATCHGHVETGAIRAPLK